MPDARIVGQILVASLPDAITPVVWRLDLGATQASALEVREDALTAYVLVLKTPDGKPQDVAVYAVKADAVRALMAVSHALFSAPAAASAAPVPPGMAYPPYAYAVPPRRNRWKSWAIVIFLLLVVAFLLLHGPRRYVDSPAPAADQAAGNATAPAPVTGVPQSADSFLQQQGQ